MAGADIIRGPTWQGMTVAFLARMRNPAGAYVTQASLASLAYSIFDLKSLTPTIATATGTLTIATAIFDALQKDARWTVDSIGYNFLWLAPGSLFPNAPNEYRVKILFTGTDGTVFPLVFQPTTQPLF